MYYNSSETLRISTDNINESQVTFLGEQSGIVVRSHDLEENAKIIVSNKNRCADIWQP